MKKAAVTFVLFSLSTVSFSQELLSKKGARILPEAKDWSIGLQADPLLKYFGNFFTGDQNDNAVLKPQIPLTITGQYIKDAHTAYRLKIRIGLASRTVNNFVDDDDFTGVPPKAKTTDTWKTTSTNLYLGTGLKKIRGKGRLQGFYGLEAGVGFESSTDSYTCGNPFSAGKSDPTSTTDWTTKDSSGNYVNGPVTSRISKVKNPKQFDFMLSGFIGGEYFFAPKLSISAEYGWGLILSATGERETFNVTADGASGTETSTHNAKNSEFSLDVRDAGAITLHLYF